MIPDDYHKLRSTRKRWIEVVGRERTSSVYVTRYDNRRDRHNFAGSVLERVFFLGMQRVRIFSDLFGTALNRRAKKGV